MCLFILAACPTGTPQEFPLGACGNNKMSVVRSHHWWHPSPYDALLAKDMRVVWTNLFDLSTLLHDMLAEHCSKTLMFVLALYLTFKFFKFPTPVK